METVKSPLRANYCRLPVKSRAERLFDQICTTKTTFADLSNSIDLHRGKTVADYSKKKRRSTCVQPKSKTIESSFDSSSIDSSVSSDETFIEVKCKPKRKAQFATYAGTRKKKTCIRKKDALQCTKESVLDAFLKAGLPDYEAIAALPLNVVVMDSNNKSEEEKNSKQSDHISRRQIVKPFIPLLKKIDSVSRDNSLLKDNNPVINVESPSHDNLVDDISIDSDAETVIDESQSSLTENKGVSTPIQNSKRTSPPRFDLSVIPSAKFIETSTTQDVTATPKGPPPAKKKPWNVVDRRGTDLLPPHPVVFDDEPNVISNDSIEVSNDQPLDWSNVHSVAEMDESVFSVFSQNSIKQFNKEIRDSIQIYKSSQPPREEQDRSLRFYRRSIVETANTLHALGKSCRTIIRESPPIGPRKSTRKRRNTILENPARSFLVAFDKTFVEDEDKQLPITSKDKVLSLCNPPNITSFSNALDGDLIRSMVKIGEGSYGEVFKSKTKEDQEVVVKVVPLVANTTTEDEKWTQILPELVISLTFGDLRIGKRNRTPNFINTLRASCTYGRWPRELIYAWEKYHKEKESENMHPDKYGPRNNWLIILLNNGGVELDNYQFNSASQALSVILQTTISLAAAEEEFEFEHRDLHTGNVLIMPCTESHLDYKVNNKNIKLPSMNLKVSVIDFTLARMAKDGYIVYDDLSKYEEIFTGEGDYQFEIYRLMRKANGNDWKSFTPYTNILWIHYLSTKLAIAKKYKSKSKANQGAMKALKSLKDNLLNYNSAQQFVQSSYFNTMISKLP
ncbi:LOW QUALITY PROTEIN: serine/threonine-protein kinase haspin-like [Panonychus citri]|uniref:LOW QUALITY PROTEIN: serine/threonine-protein kinase haspin-like n=1 Tax=Panonychus citri TaxID=50023 RepID=UPI0023075FD8|nr:LOW QUALITY PROTEIN: serine/threonine-protein kinase haspin-like [Panonychus citri]